LIGFPPNKCSKFLLLSLKYFTAKRSMGYARVIHKKEEEKKEKI
jgi:hypothetical protein